MKYISMDLGKETTQLLANCREHSVYAPSQWETTLHCNVVSYWLGTYTKWSLHIGPIVLMCYQHLRWISFLAIVMVGGSASQSYWFSGGVDFHFPLSFVVEWELLFDFSCTALFWTLFQIVISLDLGFGVFAIHKPKYLYSIIIILLISA